MKFLLSIYGNEETWGSLGPTCSRAELEEAVRRSTSVPERRHLQRRLTELA